MTTARLARALVIGLTASLILAATTAAAKDTNVLIPTQDEAIEVVQAAPAVCSDAKRGETGLSFRYGRAAVYRQNYAIFDGNTGGASRSSRHLVRICLNRRTLAAGEKRVSQGSVTLTRGNGDTFIVLEGQCLLLVTDRLSIALTGLPVLEIAGKQQKQQLQGSVCLRKQRR